MKKILIIPSWYPSEKNPIAGSFFQEQVAFLYSKGFDVRVLYIQEEKTTLVNSIHRKITSKSLSFNELKHEPLTLSGILHLKEKK